MKEQYVGDINDYYKYALLRRLERVGLRIGICWMLTPPDDRPDGRKLGYLERQEIARFDAELFALIGPVARETSARRIRLLERAKIIPGAAFFSEYVPIDPALRKYFVQVALERLAASDLIFFDPDNGLDIRSVRKGAPDSPKFVYKDEIAETYQAGHSILIYQHFPRERRDLFISRIVSELRTRTPNAAIDVFKTGHVAFVLIGHPRHAARLSAADLIHGVGPEFISLHE